MLLGNITGNQDRACKAHTQ